MRTKRPSCTATRSASTDSTNAEEERDGRCRSRTGRREQPRQALRCGGTGRGGAVAERTRHVRYGTRGTARAGHRRGRRRALLALGGLAGPRRGAARSGRGGSAGRRQAADELQPEPRRAAGPPARERRSRPGAYQQPHPRPRRHDDAPRAVRLASRDGAGAPHRRAHRTGVGVPRDEPARHGGHGTRRVGERGRGCILRAGRGDEPHGACLPGRGVRPYRQHGWERRRGVRPSGYGGPRAVPQPDAVGDTRQHVEGHRMAGGAVTSRSEGRPDRQHGLDERAAAAPAGRERGAVRD